MKEESTFGKILIIDDEKDNTEIIKDILEDVSYSIMLAKSAAEAKAILSTNDFDLILMDVWMPGQDGISLLSEWYSEGFNTPVVMMSGHAEPSDIVRAMKLGAVDFLKKPLHDFLPILRNIMTREEPEQAIQHVSGIDYSLKLKEARNIFESQYLLHHLSVNDNNIAVVAEIAGLERTTLYRKLKDLGIDKK
ncbi:MAG: response regulator [Thiotrichales bacterium]|jgi:DNA-binding NtrC family response regulator|nr:response regulator [Thiotrichales bacterium]MBT3854179.1 response regulator [Thiotrichales bacterium]MBT4653608.1 response regulator [Thiotrichales bacterium]MBT5500270.1 response regulator [Thiotrichales bacterium]MBT7149956.1 response regulator [Thiotrichales bacterium]